LAVRGHRRAASPRRQGGSIVAQFCGRGRAGWGNKTLDASSPVDAPPNQAFDCHQQLLLVGLDQRNRRTDAACAASTTNPMDVIFWDVG